MTSANFQKPTPAGRRLCPSLCLVLSLFTAFAQDALPQTFWQGGDKPFGVGVAAIFFDSNGAMLAGTRGAGIYRSTDDGDNWTPINTGLNNKYVTALSRNYQSYLFAGTSSGVFRSADHGENWQADPSGVTRAVNCLITNSSGHIFAGTASGVWRSQDNGEHWEAVNNGLSASDIRCFAITPTGHIFAGAFGGGVFRTSDNGVSWTAQSRGLQDQEDITTIAFDSHGHLFAGTRGHGVFRFQSTGETWVQTSHGLANLYVNALAGNRTGLIVTGTAGNGVLTSVDEGETWQAVNAGLSDLEVWSLAINLAGFLFAGTGYAGVFRTTATTTAILPGNAAVSAAFVLDPNFPNPFNAGTILRYEIPQTSHVRLVIFDVRGQQVVVLVEARQTAGKYLVKWEAKTLASGIYFCRMQIDERESGGEPVFSMTRKMLLLR